MSLLSKGLDGKSSDSGSSNGGDSGSSNGGDSGSSNGGGSGNNSDNSALISLGNTSFGFNFDSEEGTMNNSPGNSNSEEGDSDEGVNKPKGGTTSRGPKSGLAGGKPPTTATKSGSPVAPSTIPSDNDAAAAAVANLQSIAEESNKAVEEDSNRNKRKASDGVDNDSGGYNTDDEGKADRADEAVSSNLQGGKSQGQKQKKKKLNEMKREERNAREKERSFRISKQINDLRNLLSSGGVIVPKGTKSSVLTEAANYIRMLQQHQFRSEIDRHQLVQQIQMIGGGALGQPAATAVRHVAAQNGVWSLGNFGGVPPKSAMMYHQPGATATPGDPLSDPSVTHQAPGQPPDAAVLPNSIDEPDYRYVFNSCTVGMAIASMGGAFIDCNELFCQLASYTKQEICSMTIFNLTARQDLQHAFDLISQMLSSPMESPEGSSSNACILRGALKDRTDLGLSVTLIKGEDAVAKCFCVTLVVNPASPFDSARPQHATIEYVRSSVPYQTSKDPQAAPLDPAPAYTTG